MKRHELSFRSGNERCAAYWYVPEHAGPRPVVVMAHGMGATRKMGLDAFARRFCAAGLCVLAFDYRHYGDSTGEPRELMSIARQLADYRAALAFAKRRPEVDPERVALWGFSFSGGHVMALSAEPLGVRAAIAQHPFVSGSAARKSVSWNYTKHALPLALRDGGRALFQRHPVYMPLFGPGHETALMANDECTRDYPSIVPEELAREGGWNNRVAARICLSLPHYEPARRLQRPGPRVLVIAGERDTMAPLAWIAAALAASGRSVLVRHASAHFDCFHGLGFERAVSEQLAFLRDQLALEGLGCADLDGARQGEHSSTPTA